MAGYEAEYCCTFHHFEPVGAEPSKSGMGIGDGGGINHQSICRVAERFRDGFGRVIVGYGDAFVFKSASEVGGGTVISTHIVTAGFEIAFEGRHSNTSGANEVYVFFLLHAYFLLRI